MTLSTVLPTTMQGLLTALTAMITDVNALWAYHALSSLLVGYRAETMAAGATELASVDTPLEVIHVTPAAAVSLAQITGGRAGMIKILIPTNALLTVVESATMYLDGDVDYTLASQDLLVLLNIGGDPDTATDGYWREIIRKSL
jgi:hypothetical protein